MKNSLECHANLLKLSLISMVSGFLKPVLAIVLFLGLGFGLIALQPSQSKQMVSYLEFKETKNLPTEELKTINEFSLPQSPQGSLKNKITPVLDKAQEGFLLSREALEQIQKGMGLAEKGKFNSAEMEFKKAAKLNPRSPEVHAIWATALRMAKKYKSAEKHFSKANELAPNDEEILLNWGMSKLMDGDIEGAIRLMQMAIALNPNNALTHNYLGKAFGRKKDYAAEEASYRKALELQPDFAQSHFNLAVVLSLAKKFDRAAMHFRRAIALDRQFNKPFVERFLAQYDKVKEIQGNKKAGDLKETIQTAKLDTDGRKEKEPQSQGLDHNMEGSSGKVENEFTRVWGTVKLNGQPLGSSTVVFLETKDKLRVPGQKTQVVTIRQRNLRFVPRHSVVFVGSTIKFVNDDNEVHNIYSKSLSNQFNLGAMAAGSSKVIMVEDAGPIVLRCNIHKDMVGTLFVVPNGYYTELEKNGEFEFKSVKSKEYFLQVWHPQLYPEEVDAAMKSIGLTGRDVTYDFDIKSQSKSGEIHDMVDKTDYDTIVTNIEKLLYDAITSWIEGNKYKPRKQILIAITKHYDGEGLKGAIAKSFNEKRSVNLEEKLDAIRKKLSGIIKDESMTVESLKNEAAFVISRLRFNVRELKARVAPVQPGKP